MNSEAKIEELEKRVEKLEKILMVKICNDANDKRGRLNGMGERPF